MTNSNVEWVCVHWSKAGKEIESVEIFATESEANDCADEITASWFNFKGEFVADPRESVTVMPRSEWEVC